ncbi:MAG: Stp1/IreP family PP2C-type Ser/Thr phosphatase [Firmicutes bacterium]|nr:Stp1/IreP family PP2C-type Ser/Thr phosphatase [Bacillota bacterium]
MLSVGFKTDKGMKREANEDSVFVLPDRQLYIVADGVGGRSSGEVASRMAVESIANYVNDRPIEDVPGGSALRAYFQDALSEANSRIYEKASPGGSFSGMATTCVLCYIRNDYAFVVNVGDSRAYLVREGEIHQVTEDHSAVRELVRSGLITEDEAKVRPDRNIITRALGGESRIETDFFSFELFPGDTLILCTDGLYSEVEERRIAELCGRYKTMYRLTRQLVDEANRNGGSDNVSVVCIRIQ